MAVGFRYGNEDERACVGAGEIGVERGEGVARARTGLDPRAQRGDVGGGAPEDDSARECGSEAAGAEGDAHPEGDAGGRQVEMAGREVDDHQQAERGGEPPEAAEEECAGGGGIAAQAKREREGGRGECGERDPSVAQDRHRRRIGRLVPGGEWKDRDNPAPITGLTVPSRGVVPTEKAVAGVTTEGGVAGEGVKGDHAEGTDEKAGAMQPNGAAGAGIEERPAEREQERYDETKFFGENPDPEGEQRKNERATTAVGGKIFGGGKKSEGGSGPEQIRAAGDPGDGLGVRRMDGEEEAGDEGGIAPTVGIPPCEPHHQGGGGEVEEEVGEPVPGCPTAPDAGIDHKRKRGERT